MTTSKRAVSGKMVMSIVGGLTAILTLGFALQQMFGAVGKWREDKQRTAELIAVAQEQRASRHYDEAWASLQEAAEVDDDNDDVAIAREDLAMAWLRDARVRVGEQTFSDLVKPLLPVLQSGALKAQGARKADLLAHAGYADYLRWKDGERAFQPDTQYKRAVEIDARNPYAHAMWGHWILFTGGDFPAAQEHFKTAIAANRERGYVRSMQVAGILNRRGDDSDEVMLALSNEMRQQGDAMEAESRHKIFWETCTTRVRHAPGWERATNRISPADEIATMRWLAGTDERHKDLLLFCEARAHAWAGDTTRALSMLRALATNASGDAIRWDAKRVADRLAQNR